MRRTIVLFVSLLVPALHSRQEEAAGVVEEAAGAAWGPASRVPAVP